MARDSSQGHGDPHHGVVGTFVTAGDQSQGHHGQHHGWGPIPGPWGPSLWLGTFHGTIGTSVTEWWGHSSWTGTHHRAIVVTIVAGDLSQSGGDPHHHQGPIPQLWGPLLCLGTLHGDIGVPIVTTGPWNPRHHQRPVTGPWGPPVTAEDPSWGHHGPHHDGGPAMGTPVMAGELIFSLWGPPL